MIIFPAIDIKDGKVVRLIQGKFSEVTEYAKNPVAIARYWVDKGAQWLHVVDLDGAQHGEMKNLHVIEAIVEAVDIPIQVGGGIRREKDLEHLFKLGVKRAILGTRVIEDKNFRKAILQMEKERIAVSLDCSNGMVAQRGWTEVSTIKAVDFAKELQDAGLQCLIYTDISRDGMLTGPNLEGLNQILDAVHISVIASGGIADIDDIKKLYTLEPKGLIGAITGKAIYEGTLNLEDAIKLCSKNE